MINDPPHPTQQSALGGKTRVLERAECHQLLRECGWGVLSVTEVANARPYAVPVAYAFDGEEIYIAITRGRKLRALESHSGLCLTVMDVAAFGQWRSVVVLGNARWLNAAADRAAAVRAFVRQRGVVAATTPTAAARFVAARTLCIDVVEMSGRSENVPGSATADIADESTDALGDELTLSRAAVAMDSMRRIVRGLYSLKTRAEWDHQISAAQLFVLREVGVAPRQSIADIARRTVANATSVAQVLSRLQIHGLIRRETFREATGAAEYTLTEAGEQVLALTPATVQERMVAGFLTFSTADQQRLADLLASWVHLAALDEVPPTMFLEPLLNERGDASA